MNSTLSQLFPTKSKRMIFIAKCALTFGIRLDTLSELLKIDKNELYNDLLLYNRDIACNLEMLFVHGMIAQEEAIASFEIFFNKLCEAARSHNKESVKAVMGEICDKKAVELKNKPRNAGDRLTDEEILIIVKYQLKYLESTKSITNFFNINYGSYLKRVKGLGNEYAKLISDFEYLCDYYRASNFANTQVEGL